MYTGKSAASLVAMVLACALTGCATVPRADVLIDDQAVYPESLSSTRRGELFIGSIKGIVYRAGEHDSKARAWIEPNSQNGLQSVYGVLAHEPSHTLWLCSVPNGFAPPKPGAATSLVAFELGSGAFRASYAFPPGRSVCNDVAVARDGSVYAADTQNGRIYRLPPGGKALELFGEDARLRGIDGITFSGSGQLYVNIVTRGVLLRVETRRDGKMGALTELTSSAPLGGPDGMRLIEGNRFLLAEGTAGRIDEITIEGDRARVRVLREGLNSSPGVTLVGDHAYAIEGKIGFLIDPKLRGQDPGPFKAIAIPLRHP
jgi:sugar lactone lactonase YvrE